MDDQAARLEEIRKLMYSEPSDSSQDILELTEDDLYDEYDDDEFTDSKFDNIAAKFDFKDTNFKDTKNQDVVNENLTHIQDNTKNAAENLELKPESDEVISSETANNAAQSIDTLKKLIKKLEKTTMQAAQSKAATLEDVVTVAVRPFLKDWLNQYLHSIVQTIVDREIQKLVTQKEEKHE